MKILGLVLLSFAALLAACKPSRSPSWAGGQSITLKGQVAGKWLATLSIGGSVEKSGTEMLASTLKELFLSDVGGRYQLAFDLSDKSGWTPNKSDILAQFSKLRANIGAFKRQNPTAPAMVAIGLTGHGLSKDNFSESPDGYIFQISSGNSQTLIPEFYFTGRELAGLIASLKADEVVMFVQSCNSGHLSNVDFMNKYSAEVARETAARNVDIAVITPVNSLIFSPLYVIEKNIRTAVLNAVKQSGDVVTYSEFKDEFIRSVCSDPEYFPRSEIKNLSAVQATVDLHKFMSLAGVDPQFFEYISPNLPLLLTHSGLSKYTNGSLRLPAREPQSGKVPVSAETQSFCAERVRARAADFSSKEREREGNLKIVQSCSSAADRESCLSQLRGEGYRPEAETVPTP